MIRPSPRTRPERRRNEPPLVAEEDVDEAVAEDEEEEACAAAVAVGDDLRKRGRFNGRGSPDTSDWRGDEE